MMINFPVSPFATLLRTMTIRSAGSGIRFEVFTAFKVLMLIFWAPCIMGGIN
jgi:hypothetical protein